MEIHDGSQSRRIQEWDEVESNLYHFKPSANWGFWLVCRMCCLEGFRRADRILVSDTLRTHPQLSQQALYPPSM